MDEFVGIVRREMPSRQPYIKQLLAAFHIAFSKYAANFSVPGTGKTTIVYTAFTYMRKSQDAHRIESILVIGPLSCFVPWQEEYEQCFGVKAKSLTIKTSRDIDLLNSFADKDLPELILINYEKMKPEMGYMAGFKTLSD